MNRRDLLKAVLIGTGAAILPAVSFKEKAWSVTIAAPVGWTRVLVSGTHAHGNHVSEVLLLPPDGASALTKNYYR